MMRKALHMVRMPQNGSEIMECGFLKDKKAAEIPRLQTRNFSAAHFCYIEILCVISCAAGVAARPPLAVSLSSHGIR